MGAPLNTLAGALVFAFVIYTARHGTLGELMNILGLSNASVASPPSTTSKDPNKVVYFDFSSKSNGGGKK